MAAMSINWLVWRLYGLKLGTDFNFDGSLPRNKQDNRTIPVAAMPFHRGNVQCLAWQRIKIWQRLMAGHYTNFAMFLEAMCGDCSYMVVHRSIVKRITSLTERYLQKDCPADELNLFYYEIFVMFSEAMCSSFVFLWYSTFNASKRKALLRQSH
ncbi:uncharacterized protein LACBIDRAFT_333481 [Laccaria bicolor S238N-H82]|uniref:Predicted protein n=1 Tax=Laccaria bicolor (strain S238N-H82 / ATCC MYA-4686) TaxID=486041 RepID=B0DW24_LACBS|nr:uncharacterized protein LACBIDRAFT_333481 [Laccaria bicolor S238N-H82]EDR01237.1 predicted protein [Laccaria bicolor S238N-H82]|eukprot:XP_001888113.1 predicted protein [Laccaria bicolor S238N-H82]